MIDTKIQTPEPVAWLIYSPAANHKHATTENVETKRLSDGSVVYTSSPLVMASEVEAYAAAKVRESQGWQPIETAPKDGTEIWVFNGEQGVMKWFSCEQTSLWVWKDDLLSDIDPSPDQPTHWKPLPAPPTE